MSESNDSIELVGIKPFSDIHYVYLIVVASNELDRSSIWKYGVTMDPWNRYKHHRRDYQKENGYEKEIKMIILIRCSADNLPDVLRTPYVMSRTVEHIVEGISPTFPNRHETAHAGDGRGEEPNAKLLARMLPILSKEVDALIDSALANRIYVTKVNKKEFYNCSTCLKPYDSYSAVYTCYVSHKRDKEVSCSICNLIFEDRAARKAHYETTEHRRKANDAKVEKGGEVSEQERKFPYPCGICNLRFETKRLRKNHYNRKSHKRQARMNQLGDEEVDEELLKFPHPCLTCNLRFETRDLQLRHYESIEHKTKAYMDQLGSDEEVDEELLKFPYPCLTCNLRFETIRLRKNHYHRKAHKAKAKAKKDAKTKKGSKK